MNLEQIRDSIRIRLGVPTNDNFYTDVVLDDLVNEAIQAISIEADWPWLQDSATITTAAGTQAYTPTVDAGHVWLRTRVLTPTDRGEPLSLRSLSEIREYLSTDQAEPQYYCVSGEQILLAPIPNAVKTITHDYVRQETPLVNNTDEPALPLPFRYAIVHLAAAMGHLRQNQPERWGSEMRSYNEWLGRMNKSIQRVTANKRVRVRRGSML